MSQPVVDTLELSDALRRTGMERGQAEALARTLGKELGAHVAVQDNVDASFQQVRTDLVAQIEKVRSDLSADIRKVDHKVDLVRAELGAVASKQTFMIAGFGLFVAALTLASGMGVFQPAPSSQVPTVTPPPSELVPATQAPAARSLPNS